MARTGSRPTANKTDAEIKANPLNEKLPSGEVNRIISKINADGLNEAYTNVIKFDDNYYPDIHTMSGDEVFTIDDTNAGSGNGGKHSIVGDGNTLTFTGFTIRESDLLHTLNVVTTVYGHVYTIIFLRVGSVSEVYIRDTGEIITSQGLISATIGSPANHMVMVFSENYTMTIGDWNIDTDATDAVTISSVVSGDGTTNITVLLSRRVLDSETLNIDNAVLGITDQAITNNSIIVMQDGFLGTTIDTGLWTVENPSDSINITQEASYLNFDIDTDGSGVPSSNTNYIDSIDGVAEGCVEMNFSGDATQTDSALSMTFAGDWSNFHLAQIFAGGGDKAVFTVYSGGAKVYENLDLLYDIKTTWRIRYQISNTTTYFEELTAPDTWTTRDSYVADITNGNNLTARLAASNKATGVGVVTWSTQYAYLTKGNYSTSQP